MAIRLKLLIGLDASGESSGFSSASLPDGISLRSALKFF
jgi:hypothetical protein